MLLSTSIVLFVVHGSGIPLFGWGLKYIEEFNWSAHPESEPRRMVGQQNPPALPPIPEPKERPPVTACRGFLDTATYVLVNPDTSFGQNYMEVLYDHNITGLTYGVREPVDWVDRLHMDPEAKTSMSQNAEKYATAHFGVQTTREVADFVNYLELMKLAYDDKYEKVLILKDNMGLQLCPLWPASLHGLIYQSNTNYPGWKVLRLQWDDKPGTRQAIKDEYWNVMHAMLEDLDHDELMVLDRTWGRWEGGPSLILPYSGGFGAVANVWTHQGLEQVLKKFTHGNVIARSTEQTIWECPSGLPCNEEAIYTPFGESDVLVTVPPMITERLAVDPAASDVKVVERRVDLLAFASQWLLEWTEMTKTLGLDLLPWKNLKFVGRSVKAN